MTDTIIVAILSLVGTFIGTLGGILAANKLVAYRIDQLEKKVEKHNGVIERVFKLETRLEVDEKVIDHLKKYHDDGN
jgi:hypothetical protein